MCPFIPSLYRFIGPNLGCIIPVASHVSVRGIFCAEEPIFASLPGFIASSILVLSRFWLSRTVHRILLAFLVKRFMIKNWFIVHELIHEQILYCTCSNHSLFISLGRTWYNMRKYLTFNLEHYWTLICSEVVWLKWGQVGTIEYGSLSCNFTVFYGWTFPLFYSAIPNLSLCFVLSSQLFEILIFLLFQP